MRYSRLLSRPSALWLLSLLAFAACSGERAPSVGDSARDSTPPGGASQGPDSAAARAAADRLWAETVGIFTRGDTAAIGSIYTEDAVLISESRETRGREAIRARFREIFPRTSYTRFDHTTEHFEASGGLAVEEGVIQGATEPKGGKGRPTAVTLRYLAVYERQPDGRWLYRYVVTVPLDTAAGRR